MPQLLDKGRSLMQLLVYPRLNKYGKKRLKRRLWRFGKTYHYKPDLRVLRRLSKELGLSEEMVRKQINDERKFLLQYPQYY